jgi:gliding motility-associated-like protein
MKRLLVILTSLFCFLLGYTQETSKSNSCITLGQVPQTALPVCGTRGLSQSSVPIFSSSNLIVPGCSDGSSVNYTDKNPFWYKFTCYASGPISFVITPNNLGDDYDWQLYDITGRNIQDVFRDPTLVVTGNWAGTPGLTGASLTGVNYIQCASFPTDNAPNFALSPNLIQGHEYLLLVSHFDDTQSGYVLSFDIGRDNITDNTPPAISKITADLCDGTRIGLKFNKKIMCSSISRRDNLEFEILDNTGALITNPTVSFVSGFRCESGGCNTGFDTDTLSLILSDTLLPGNYTLRIKNGGDNNTLLDNCDNIIPIGTNSASFSVVPKMNAEFFWSIRYGCKYDTVSYFPKYPSGITSYQWTFDSPINNTSNSSNPVVVYPFFGNRITTVEITNQYNCKVRFRDTIYLYNTLRAAIGASEIICPDDGGNFISRSLGDSIIQWSWNFGNGNTLIENTPTEHAQTYTNASNQDYQVPVKLIVTNNLGCLDSTTIYVKIVRNCYIAVPNAFTPNGDGLNDYLYPLNAYKAQQLKFAVFDRFGNRLFYTENWTKKWDGRYKSKDAAAGTYVWYLNYFDPDRNKQFVLKGSTILIR